jgi:hypothetical protein
MFMVKKLDEVSAWRCYEASVSIPKVQIGTDCSAKSGKRALISEI